LVNQLLKFVKVENLVILQSATPKSKVSGGSALCRRELWQWVFSAVKRRTNPIVKDLSIFLDAEKLAAKPVKLMRTRVAAKAVKLLFKELVLSRKVVD
jgi:hypothetical protein